VVPPCDDYAFVFNLGSGGIRDRFRQLQAVPEPAASLNTSPVSFSTVANRPLKPVGSQRESPLLLAPAAVVRRRSRRPGPSQLTPMTPACFPWTIGSIPPRRTFDFFACTKVPLEPENPLRHC